MKELAWTIAFRGRATISASSRLLSPIAAATQAIKAPIQWRAAI
jgi:hypothetical protein